MKTVLLLFCISFCLNAKAQLSALGKSEKEITDYLTGLNTNETLIARKTLENGVTTLQFNNSELVSRAYVLKNDTCVRYMMSYSLGGLSKFVSTLNDNYTKTKANEWVDKTYSYKLTLTNDDKYFYASWEKL